MVVPIPKGHKDASCSTYYRGIAIASIISKLLELVLLSKYSEYFQSSELQFGFKKGVSTTLCTYYLEEPLQTGLMHLDTRMCHRDRY